ncbi:MAG: T9SS type A sorting domain-containing protein [Bacteroidota bacterium]
MIKIFTLPAVLFLSLLLSFTQATAKHPAASTIAVDVDSVDKTVFKGRQITDSLTISSAGEDLLIWGTSFDASWLSLSVESGALPESGSQKIILTFQADSLVQGLYVDTLNIISNDPSNAKIEIPIRLEVISEADIRISNNSFNLTLDQSNETELAVTIYNDGTEPLNWGLFTNPANNWITPGDLLSGNIEPGENTGTKIIINSAGLTEGTHTGFAWISSDDPDTPTSLMNITLEVDNDFANITFSLSDTSFCPGESKSFIFSVLNASPQSGNIFSAELSNEYGDFAESQVVGSLTSTAINGLMTLTIPQQIQEGGRYRIRITSSQPSLEGKDNGDNLEIGSIVPISWDPIPNQCVNDGSILLSGVSPAGGVFSGSGITDSTFTPSSAGPGTHTITYTYSGFAGCSSIENQDILVRDKPNISMNTFESLCEDQESVELGGLPVGGNYAGVGVSGDQFTPEMAGEGFHIVSYAYTDINGCSNNTSTGINVLSVPTANLLNFDPVCVEGDSISLSGGFPEGGEYLGPGVISGSFFPDSVGEGDYNISYVYTNQVGCVDTAIASISVREPVSGLSIPDYGGVCEDGAEISMQGATPNGGVYKGPGVFGGIFDPVDVGPGNYTITYVYTDGCSDSVNSVIEVYAKPDTPVIQLLTDTLSTSEAFSSYQWFRNDTLIQGAISGELIAGKTGVYKVRVTNAEGCDQVSAPFAYVATSTELLISNDFSLFPNPVDSELVIAWPENVDGPAVTLSLINLSGQRLWQDTRSILPGENKLFLSREHIPAGYYFLVISSGQGTGRKKIMLR